MLGFIIWAVFGLAFIGLGIYCFFSRKEVAFGFWANAETFPVKDIKAYNKAGGKLWCGFGLGFICIGIPLLGGQNSPGAILSILGAMFLAISTMVIYVVVIEGKYRDEK